CAAAGAGEGALQDVARVARGAVGGGDVAPRVPAAEGTDGGARHRSDGGRWRLLLVEHLERERRATTRAQEQVEESSSHSGARRPSRGNIGNRPWGVKRGGRVDVVGSTRARPWRSVRGTMSGTVPLAAPRPAVVLGRALRLRCPRCGRTRLFAGWFRMRDTCAACGLRYEREQGYFVGAIYVNYLLTAALGLG